MAATHIGREEPTMSWTVTTPSRPPTAPDDGTPAATPARPARSDQVRTLRYEHARNVLELARVIVERGWLRRSAYAAPPRPVSGLRSLLRRDPGPTPDDVRAACLVGAVMVSAQHVDPRADLLTNAGPAVDALWDAWCEQRGMPGPAVSGRAAPAAVRVGRIRELVRWNDSSAKDQDEVLGLLDRAISRTIVSAMSGSGTHARR
jgi:hypothetical protein